MPQRLKVTTDKGNFYVTVATPLETANATHLHEPTTYGEGFEKSIKDTAYNAGAGILDSFKAMNPFKAGPSIDDQYKSIDAELHKPRVPFGSPSEMLSSAKAGLEKHFTDPRAMGHDIGDLSALLGGSIASRVPVRSAVSGALRTGADFVEHPAITTSKVMRGAADAVGDSGNGGGPPKGFDRFMPNKSPSHFAVDADNVYDNPKIDTTGGQGQVYHNDNVPPDLGRTLEGMLTESKLPPEGSGSPHPEGRSGDPVAVEQAPTQEPQSISEAPDYINQEIGGWHSGAEPGSDDALGASKLHRDDASLLDRLKHIMGDDKNDYRGGR